jgi:peptidoglycan-associated lipoprotein
MRQHPSIRVTVEGHADSRGTNEYNLAMGERRASAVRDYLVGLGMAGRAYFDREQGRRRAALPR